MLQNFDRVVVRIDRRCERFPFCFGRAHELDPRRVSRNATIQPAQLKPQQPQISEQQNQNPQVSATDPDKPFSPFQLPRQLQAAAAPAFRQKIQLDRRWRQFNSDDLGGAGQNSLDRLAQFVAGLIKQNILIGSVYALQFGTQSQLRQFELEMIAVTFDRPRKAEFAVLGHGVNEHLAFGINQKSIALGRVCGGALRGIHSDLPRNETVVQEWRSHLRKLLVSDRNRRHHALTFILFDQLKIARYFIGRKWQQLFDLKTNHFWKFRRIDTWQTEPLCNHSGDGQAEDKLVARRE